LKYGEEKDMQNKVLRKELVVGIIILFIGMSVGSSNAVTIKKEEFLDEEITGEYTLNIVILIDDIVPIVPLILPCKVVVTHEDNPSFRIVKYKIYPFISIKITEKYPYPNVNVYSLGYEQIRTYWQSYDNLDIYIRWAVFPKTLNNPFINRLPVFNQLLQLEVE
jgi:hypothetical protein